MNFLRITIIAFVIVSATLALEPLVGLARTPGSYSGVVYLDNNGNGTRDDGEAFAASIEFTMAHDSGDFQESFVSANDGSFRVEGLLAEFNRFSWKLCPVGSWWITKVDNAFNRADLGGCRLVRISSGENATAIGVQDMSAQASAPATLSAAGFSDHNRNGSQDSGETGYQLKTRLFLNGPTPNPTRASQVGANGTMIWGPVFAPADGYAWLVCLDYEFPDDIARYEITSVTPGGSPAADGCWHITIAPGDNTLVFGFYDRLQPEGTPTPTMTSTPAPTAVPIGMHMALDCDPSQDSVQSSCDVTLGDGVGIDVDVVLVNDTAGDQHASSLGAGVSTDRARLFPPPFPEAGARGNPDPNPLFIEQGFECFLPEPFSNDFLSYVGCFSGTTTLFIAAGSTTRLATIHYVVVDGTGPGAVNLDYVAGDYSDGDFTDWKCPDGEADPPLLSACVGATITLVAPATATPSPAARFTATATAVEQAHAQGTSTPHAAQVNAVAPSARVVSQVNAVVAPVASTPRVGVLGANVQPPNAGDGPGASRSGGTWSPMVLLLLLSGGGVLAVVYARAVRR